MNAFISNHLPCRANERIHQQSSAPNERIRHRHVRRELNQSEARDVASSIVRSGAELLAPDTPLDQRWREATWELAPPPRGYAGPARPAGEPAALDFDMQVAE